MTTTALEWAAKLHDGDARVALVREALDVGATEEQAVALALAGHVAHGTTVVVPAQRLEHCSRGRGWARFGRGDDVTWGARVAGGYRLDAVGRWSVGATDGFARKRADVWDVTRITVGDRVWTVAS